MRVRMLTDRRGSPDGIHAELYQAGQVYDLPPDLAEPWLAKGICEQDKMLPGPSETKDGPQPEQRRGRPAKRK